MKKRTPSIVILIVLCLFAFIFSTGTLSKYIITTTPATVVELSANKRAYTSITVTKDNREQYSYTDGSSSLTFEEKYYLDGEWQSVTAIGEGAFQNCASLKTVDLPDSLTAIESNAFAGTGLTSVAIPAAVTTIADGAFAGCTALTGYTVDGGNANYSAADGVLYNKAGTSLLHWPGGKSGVVRIPTAVTISDSAFADASGVPAILYTGDASQAPWGSTGALIVNNQLGDSVTVSDVTRENKGTAETPQWQYTLTLSGYSESHVAVTDKNGNVTHAAVSGSEIVIPAAAYSTDRRVTLQPAKMYAFAVLAADNTLSVYNRANTIPGSGESFTPDNLTGTVYKLPTAVGVTAPDVASDWTAAKASVTTVTFEDTITPTDSTANWFSGFTACTAINLHKNGTMLLNTSSVTDMSGMFENCQLLKELDLTGLDTANVSTMNKMFRMCKALTGASRQTPVSALADERGVIFGSSFTTDNLTDMSSMFAGCSSMLSIDLSGFNTARVTSMASLFANCAAVRTIRVDDGWTTAAVTSYVSMFDSCRLLVGCNGTIFNYANNYLAYAKIDRPGVPGYLTGDYTTFMAVELGVTTGATRWEFTDGKVDFDGTDTTIKLVGLTSGISEVLLTSSAGGNVIAYVNTSNNTIEIPASIIAQNTTITITKANVVDGTPTATTPEDTTTFGTRIYLDSPFRYSKWSQFDTTTNISEMLWTPTHDDATADASNLGDIYLELVDGLATDPRKVVIQELKYYQNINGTWNEVEVPIFQSSHTLTLDPETGAAGVAVGRPEEDVLFGDVTAIYMKVALVADDIPTVTRPANPTTGSFKPYLPVPYCAPTDDTYGGFMEFDSVTRTGEYLWSFSDGSVAGYEDVTFDWISLQVADFKVPYGTQWLRVDSIKYYKNIEGGYEAVEVPLNERIFSFDLTGAQGESKNIVQLPAPVRVGDVVAVYVHVTLIEPTQLPVVTQPTDFYTNRSLHMYLYDSGQMSETVRFNAADQSAEILMMLDHDGYADYNDRILGPVWIELMEGSSNETSTVRIDELKYYVPVEGGAAYNAIGIPLDASEHTLQLVNGVAGVRLGRCDANKEPDFGDVTAVYIKVTLVE